MPVPLSEMAPLVTSPASQCVPPAEPKEVGQHLLVGEGAGEPIRTIGEKARPSVYFVYGGGYAMQGSLCMRNPRSLLLIMNCNTAWRTQM